VEEVEEGVQEASSVQALDDHEVVGRVFAKFLDVHDSFVNCEEEKGGHECEEEGAYGDCYFVLQEIAQHASFIVFGSDVLLVD